MNVTAITRRLERLEVRAAVVGPKKPLFLEARDAAGAWTGAHGGRWVAGSEVYHDADLCQLERRYSLILVCCAGVNHDD